MPDGDSVNLWEIELSPRTGKVVGSPQRLTTGAGSDLRASCASGGALAFAKVETRSDIWFLPFDLDRGTSTGSPERITQGPPWHDNPSLARNGGFIAFASDRSGRGNIWLRELVTVKEQTVAASPFAQRYPSERCLRRQGCVFCLREGQKSCVCVRAGWSAREGL